jgi:hypothetical protein
MAVSMKMTAMHKILGGELVGQGRALTGPMGKGVRIRRGNRESKRAMEENRADPSLEKRG